MEGYKYSLPKCGHPRTWRRRHLSAVREYWFQACNDDGDTVKLVRKSFTWAGACNYGDAFFLKAGGTIAFLIDGRVPREELDCPPTAAIWNRWQREPFVEDGFPCQVVAVLPGGSVEIGKFRRN